MNRRDALRFSAAGALATVATVAIADETVSPSGHGAHNAATGHEQHRSAGQYSALIAASAQCVTAGDACLTHCLAALGEGDTELAQCARTVRDTIAACSALRELASANSPHTKELAKVVGAICGDCGTECKKHEKHSICKDCEKACRDCKDLCDKLAAA